MCRSSRTLCFRAQPYFTRWDGTGLEPKYGPQTADDGLTGTYGLKKTYVQETPLAEFAPLNYAPYKQFVDRCEVRTSSLASWCSILLRAGRGRESNQYGTTQEAAETAMAVAVSAAMLYR